MQNIITIIFSAGLLTIMFSELQAQTVSDIDGNVYKTITIETQIWMTENLKTTKYNDGTSIPFVTGSTWASLTTPGYCWYNHDTVNYKNIFGALYNWHAVNTGKLCPTGWHVPDNEEWKSLETFLGGAIIAGGKLKETGTKHWLVINTGATNETGFTALPGGYRYGKGKFGSIGYFGYWWSASEAHSPYASCYYLGNESNSLLNHLNYRRNGYSVRCLKN
jgi:uncharacterized protein (TIGR02145 family)